MEVNQKNIVLLTEYCFHHAFAVFWTDNEQENYLKVPCDTDSQTFFSSVSLESRWKTKWVDKKHLAGAFVANLGEV